MEVGNRKPDNSVMILTHTGQPMVIAVFQSSHFPTFHLARIKQLQFTNIFSQKKMTLSVDAMIRTHMQVKVDIMCLLLPLAFLPSCDCTVILHDFVLRQKIHVFNQILK